MASYTGDEPAQYYDVFYVDGDQLYFGERENPTSGFSREERPVSIDSRKVFYLPPVEDGV